MHTNVVWKTSWFRDKNIKWRPEKKSQLIAAKTNAITYCGEKENLIHYTHTHFYLWALVLTQSLGLMLITSLSLDLE